MEWSGRFLFVIGHLGLNVADLAAAKAYFDRFMPILGFDVFLDHDDEFAYRPANGKPGTYLFFYPAEVDGDHDRRRAGLQHLAFMVPTHEHVHRLHELAQSLGSTIVHPPQSFPQYPPPYYATFWLDPHGFLLEAVCHHER